METEQDKAIGGTGKPDEGAKFNAAQPALAPLEADLGAAANHERPAHAGPDLISDERLNSAAAPFLYLLAVVLTAAAGYFVYMFLHG